MAALPNLGTPAKFECLLYGAVNATDRARLIERLEGIGAVESSVFEHEVSCCTIQNIARRPSPKSQADAVLRLVCELNDEALHQPDLWARTWSIKHYFANDADRKRPSNVRGMLNIPIAMGNPFEMVISLGFCPDYEFVRRGVRYFVRNRVTVSITQLARLARPHDVASMVPHPAYDSQYLVELCVVCGQEDINDASDELRRFADAFMEIAQFYHVDYSKVLHQR